MELVIHTYLVAPPRSDIMARSAVVIMATSIAHMKNKRDNAAMTPQNRHPLSPFGTLSDKDEVEPS